MANYPQEDPVAKFPPPNPPFIAARHKGGPQTPKGIVIHGTVSSDNPGTARNIANWWASPSSPVTSAHYVRDPRETIQCVGDHTVAYHCGFNTGTIGYELCDEQQGPVSRWEDGDSRAILKGAAEDVAKLCLAYDIAPERPSIAALKRKGPHGIYGHNDSRLAFGHTTHTDPRDFPWLKFLGMVRVEIAALKAEAAGEPDTTQIKFVVANIESRKSSRLLGLHIRRRKPDVVVVEQAYHARAWLETIPGYRVKQFHDSQFDNSEADGIAILVRDGVQIKNLKALVLEQEWIGPKAGKRHDGRVLPVVALKKGEKFFRVVGTHLATHNEPDAQQEGMDAIKAYFRAHPKSANFAPGDFNMTAPELRQKSAPWARVIPSGKVDHMLVANVRYAKAKRLTTPIFAHGWTLYTAEV